MSNAADVICMSYLFNAHKTPRTRYRSQLFFNFLKNIL